MVMEILDSRQITACELLNITLHVLLPGDSDPHAALKRQAHVACDLYSVSWCHVVLTC